MAIINPKNMETKDIVWLVTDLLYYSLQELDGEDKYPTTDSRMEKYNACEAYMFEESDVGKPMEYFIISGMDELLKVQSMIKDKRQKKSMMDQIREQRIRPGVFSTLDIEKMKADMGNFHPNLGPWKMLIIDDPIKEEEDEEISETESYWLDITDEARQVMLAKNDDYGEVWKEMLPTSLVDEILIKARRSRNLMQKHYAKEEAKVSEGVLSELRDIINYCVFAHWAWSQELEKDDE